MENQISKVGSFNNSTPIADLPLTKETLAWLKKIDASTLGHLRQLYDDVASVDHAYGIRVSGRKMREINELLDDISDAQIERATKKRSLLTMTLAEGIEILLLGETNITNMNVQMRRKKGESAASPEEFLQFYYLFTGHGETRPHETIVMNVSESDHGQISLCRGNNYFRTHYKITKFLEMQGFGLPQLKEFGPVLTDTERRIYKRMTPGELYEKEDICNTKEEEEALESLMTKIKIGKDSDRHTTHYWLVGCIEYSWRPKK